MYRKTHRMRFLFNSLVWFGVLVWMSCVAAAEAPSARVALLDDALPGHDQGANERLARALESGKCHVTRLTAERMVAPDVLTTGLFDVAIIPRCAFAPAALGPAAQAFQREGGHLVFLGGPFLDHPLWYIDGRWMEEDRVLRDVSPRHRPFGVESVVDPETWPRTCANWETSAGFQVTDEGPDGAPCLRMDIDDLQGWDGRQSPRLPALFGQGDALFTMQCKGDALTAQLAVEINERDGSRWIA
ncbi:MAG: hypothetical protein EOM20_21965, partial [Spartobacteria bacterium]|nr:hypothetical protein [Spartobacteria bacterium]